MAACSQIANSDRFLLFFILIGFYHFLNYTQYTVFKVSLLLYVVHIYCVKCMKTYRTCYYNAPSPREDNIRVMVIVWRLREYYHNCSVLDCVTQCSQSAAHLYEQFLQVQQIGLSHWDPYAMHRGGWLELYYCNMVEWFWWDSSLMSTYNVLSGTFSMQPNNQ